MRIKQLSLLWHTGSPTLNGFLIRIAFAADLFGPAQKEHVEVRLEPHKMVKRNIGSHDWCAVQVFRRLAAAINRYLSSSGWRLLNASEQNW